MKALVFAAGRGERMRPLTDACPKPLLEVGGKPLIAWHLEQLARIGATDVVVNTSWLAERFPGILGDGSRWGVRLHYSYEGTTPLETGGGMLNALPLLGEAPFVAVNGDIWTDFDFARLPREPAGDVHLVLVDNPAHNPNGDFALQDDGRIASRGERMQTFSGIGVYRPSLFADWRQAIGNAQGADQDPPSFRLATLLRTAMNRGAVTGEHYLGGWTDAGTPQRLRELDAAVSA